MKVVRRDQWCSALSASPASIAVKPRRDVNARPAIESVAAVIGIIAAEAAGAPTPSVPMYPTGAAMDQLLRRNVLHGLAQGGRRARGDRIGARGRPQRQERTRKRRY